MLGIISNLFTAISVPLTDLTQPKYMHWTEEQEIAFWQLKDTFVLVQLL